MVSWRAVVDRPEGTSGSSKASLNRGCPDSHSLKDCWYHVSRCLLFYCVAEQDSPSLQRVSTRTSSIRRLTSPLYPGLQYLRIEMGLCRFSKKQLDTTPPRTRKGRETDTTGEPTVETPPRIKFRISVKPSWQITRRRRSPCRVTDHRKPGVYTLPLSWNEN